MKLTLKQLLAMPILDDEWQYIINTSYLSNFDKKHWDFRLFVKEGMYPKIRRKVFLESIYHLAQKKESGIKVRDYVWSENERKLDDTKNDVVMYFHLIGKNKPVALILPGGAYALVSVMNEGFPVAKKLNSLGYNAITLVYRVKNHAKNFAPVFDLQKAVEYIRNNAKELDVDADKLSIWGSSAAGHLTAYFGAKYNELGNNLKPNALVLSYPVITLNKYTHQQTRDNFFGGTFTQSQLDEYSCENLVNGSYPPTYLWHSVTDMSVPVFNSDIFNEKLNEFNVEHFYHRFNSGNHGIGRADGMPQSIWIEEAVDFCNKVFDEK